MVYLHSWESTFTLGYWKEPVERWAFFYKSTEDTADRDVELELVLED